MPPGPIFSCNSHYPALCIASNKMVRSILTLIAVSPPPGNARARTTTSRHLRIYGKSPRVAIARQWNPE